MRTSIVIDDELMAQALKASGAKTRKEAVELGLKTRQPARRPRSSVRNTLYGSSV